MSSTDRFAPLRTLAAVLALAGLSACATAPPPSKAPESAAATRNMKALLAFDQYKPVVETAEDNVLLAPHAGGVLSEAQKLALSDLYKRLGDDDGAAVNVDAPAGSTAGSAADLTRRSAAGYLVGLGVRPERLKLGAYEAKAGSDAILVRFVSLQASGPDCSKGWGDYASTGSNKVNSHFGCADAANLAAMVADPRDLVRPSPDQPADAGRRAVVLGKYRKGEVTTAAKDDQASGAISQTVK
jgi:pilus assembly protein CpaD